MPSAHPKPETLASLIFLIRGEKVLLDADLALLYGVRVRALNQAVSRNRERFPADFMFQLSDEEFERVRNSQRYEMGSGTSQALRSQIVISKGRGGRRYWPYAFTEQGGCDVVERSSFAGSRRSEYRHHAYICPATPAHGFQPRTCTQDRGDGDRFMGS